MIWTVKMKDFNGKQTISTVNERYRPFRWRNGNERSISFVTISVGSNRSLPFERNNKRNGLYDATVPFIVPFRSVSYVYTAGQKPTKFNGDIRGCIIYVVIGLSADSKKARQRD